MAPSVSEYSKLGLKLSHSVQLHTPLWGVLEFKNVPAGHIKVGARDGNGEGARDGTGEVGAADGTAEVVGLLVGRGVGLLEVGKECAVVSGLWR